MGILQKIRDYFRRFQGGSRDNKPQKSRGQQTSRKARDHPSERSPAQTSAPEGAVPRDQPSPTAEQPTEPEESSSGTRETFLTIGFDWGTSCSKVIIREPYSAGRPAYLVDFEERGDDSISALLPSRLHLSDDGQAHLGQGQQTTLSDMKVRLMDATGEPVPGLEDAYPREVAALYISRALRYARRWFLDKHNDVYGGRAIVWELNLGIPAASHDEAEVCRAFESVARVAWQLSMRSTATLREAKEAFQAEARGHLQMESIHEDLINVVPEVAAQVAGYAQSDLRRTGLHVLVDVGASTLDLAGFILTDDDEGDRYSILEAAVQPLGAYRLEQERLQPLRKLGKEIFAVEARRMEWAEQMATRCQDPMRKVPSDTREYFPSDLRTEIPATRRREMDGAFQRDCFTSLRALVADLKGNRDPNSRMWRQGLPVFLAGGGQNIRVYHDALENLEEAREKYWGRATSPFQVRPLPSLEDLEGENVETEHRHRFSVAYGLSLPIDDIGVIRSPHEIPDIDLGPDSSPSYTYQDTKAWM